MQQVVLRLHQPRAAVVPLPAYGLHQVFHAPEDVEVTLVDAQTNAEIVRETGWLTVCEGKPIARVIGRVVDMQGKPVDAKLAGIVRAQTGDVAPVAPDGTFELALPPGGHTLSAQLKVDGNPVLEHGFAPVACGEDVEVEINLMNRGF